MIISFNHFEYVELILSDGEIQQSGCGVRRADFES